MRQCYGGEGIALGPGSLHTQMHTGTHKEQCALTQGLTSRSVSGDTPTLTSTQGHKDTLVSLHIQTHVLRPHAQMVTHTPITGYQQTLARSHTEMQRCVYPGGNMSRYTSRSQARHPHSFSHREENTFTSTCAHRYVRHMFPRECGKWCLHAQACTFSHTRSVGGYTHMVTHMMACD